MSKEVQRFRASFGESLERYHREQARKGIAQGIWTILALRSTDGSACTDKSHDQFTTNKKLWSQSQNTKLWNQSQAIASFLQPIEPALKRVRISVFYPQSIAAFHCDDCARQYQYDCATPSGSHNDFRVLLHRYHRWLRLHVVLSSVDDAQLHIGGNKFAFKAGQIYVANVALPHQVINKGDERVALVIDVNMEHKALLEQSALGRELLRAQRQLLAQPHMEDTYYRLGMALKQWRCTGSDRQRYVTEVRAHNFNEKLWAGPTPPLKSDLFSSNGHCGLLGDSHDLQHYLYDDWKFV
eukprot:gnl/TRDRNA2_/TRDRNA2_145193_c1_seq1.p1 gnl/TRDRNA2_/TRDRNA2_145193_c1~~gnl/TRDRNA2_/TRDRNA2_145193_c1_seq1.p1  ORF type:complete len:297 (+),score=28.13 gnl/TRDRNA2_/TRDRNA2_145193_c1_seq1:2-892(+)